MRFAYPLAVLLGLLLTAAPALAQQAPQIGNSPTNKRTLAILLSIFIMVVIGVVSFMTPKRGHQD